MLSPSGVWKFSGLRNTNRRMPAVGVRILALFAGLETRDLPEMKIRRTGDSAGLSMVEIMVVIGIVAVLVALLLPALARAKASARNAKCVSNLKQWGVTWHVYTSDNNGFFSDGQTAGFPRGEWVWALADQYTREPDLLICPDANMRRSSRPGSGGRFKEVRIKLDVPQNQATAFGGPRTVYDFPANPRIDPAVGKFWLSSYGQNNWAYNISRSSLQGRRAEFHWRQMDIGWDTSQVPLFADAMWRGGGPDHSIPEKNQAPATHGQWDGVGAESEHFSIMRHSKGINILFFDGSVRGTTSPKEVWKLKWHNSYDTDAWRTNAFPSWMP